MYDSFERSEIFKCLFTCIAEFKTKPPGVLLKYTKFQALDSNSVGFDWVPPASSAYWLWTWSRLAFVPQFLHEKNEDNFSTCLTVQCKFDICSFILLLAECQKHSKCVQNGQNIMQFWDFYQKKNSKLAYKPRIWTATGTEFKWIRNSHFPWA